MSISAPVFTVDKLKTAEGVRDLNAILSKLARNSAGDGENLRIFSGYADPSGIVQADVGSIYLRKDGSSGSSLYVKESVAASGWMPVGDSSSGDSSIPSGGIILWSGTIATIPAGWALCNGENGTPDLRDRFVICASDDEDGVAKSSINGSLSQSGDGTIPKHRHYVDTLDNNIIAMGTKVTRSTSTNPGTHYTSYFGTGTKNIAVYYSLAYIMKL